VGSNLVPTFRGREVAAICRHPRSDLPAGARSLALDVADTTRLTEALVGVDTAYYRVHSMRSGRDFAARDRELTKSFVAAATAASVRRIVYLGSIGRGDTSSHFASRRDVGAVLGDSAAEVVELRAGMVIGAGSVPFELLRRLVGRQPVLALSPWATRRTQPVAIADLLRVLRAAETDLEPGCYPVGGSDVVTFEELVRTYAAVTGRRRILVRLPVRNVTATAP